MFKGSKSTYLFVFEYDFDVYNRQIPLLNVTVLSIVYTAREIILPNGSFEDGIETTVKWVITTVKYPVSKVTWVITKRTLINYR